jgi:hypothetical protein
MSRQATALSPELVAPHLIAEKFACSAMKARGEGEGRQCASGGRHGGRGAAMCERWQAWRERGGNMRAVAGMLIYKDITHRAAKRAFCCFPETDAVRHTRNTVVDEQSPRKREERALCHHSILKQYNNQAVPMCMVRTSCMRLQSKMTEGRGSDSPVQ